MSPSAGSCEAKTEAEDVICGHLGPSNSESRARDCGRNGNLKEAEISCQNQDAMAETNNHPQQMLGVSWEPSLLLALICILGCATSKGPGGKGKELMSSQRTLTYMSYLTRL